jgi:AraC-like DNA-binding protein
MRFWHVARGTGLDVARGMPPLLRPDPFADLEVDRPLSPSVRVRRWRRAAPLPLRAAPSTHEAVEVTWIDQGAARYRIAGREHEIGPGAVMVVPAGVAHETWLSPTLSAGSLRLAGELVAQVAVAPGRALAARPLARPHAALSLARLIDAELGTPGPESAALVDALADALAIELLRAADPAPAAAPRDPRIARAIDLIESEYARPLSVEDMARAAALSRFHFSQRFRALTGRPPYQYLIEVRLARAAALLRRGGVSASFAAHSAGFTDLGRFHRMFLRRFGVRPSEIAGRAASPAPLAPPLRVPAKAGTRSPRAPHESPLESHEAH